MTNTASVFVFCKVWYMETHGSSIPTCSVEGRFCYTARTRQPALARSRSRSLDISIASGPDLIDAAGLLAALVTNPRSTLMCLGAIPHSTNYKTTTTTRAMQDHAFQLKCGRACAVHRSIALDLSTSDRLHTSASIQL